MDTIINVFFYFKNKNFILFLSIYRFESCFFLIFDKLLFFFCFILINYLFILLVKRPEQVIKFVFFISFLVPDWNIHKIILGKNVFLDRLVFFNKNKPINNNKFLLIIQQVVQKIGLFV